MITNEHQYRITKVEAERFAQALARFREIELASQGIDPVIIGAQRASLEAQLADLQADLVRYETLRSGKTRRLPVAKVGTRVNRNV